MTNCECDGPGGAKTFALQVCMPINGRVQCIDRCIHQLVAALNAGGVETRASCCGHGTQDGRIDLADGRVLVVIPKDHAEQFDELAGDGAVPGFGVEPGDSLALLQLRQRIDDRLAYPTPTACEAGDYEAAVDHAADKIHKLTHAGTDLASWVQHLAENLTHDKDDLAKMQGALKDWADARRL